MALPNDYAGQACSLARALEIVGERWTLLIVRDAFFGVRRFGDFAAHLGIPRAVLAERLKSLTAAGVLARVPAQAGPGSGQRARGGRRTRGRREAQDRRGASGVRADRQGDVFVARGARAHHLGRRAL